MEPSFTSVRLLLLVAVAISVPDCCAANKTVNNPPQGCGPNVDSLYYNLCDLSAVWGIVVEAFAGAGAIGSLVLFIVLLASLPFLTDPGKRSSMGLHAGFLVFTTGLFSLTFAFIVGRNFSTCAARRFLFGVLFAGGFSCLVAQNVRLNLLARRDTGPRGWVLCLGALGLWLVEVIINTEWLIITVVRYPTNTTIGIGSGPANAIPCNIANDDFTMALIYVMCLLLATVLTALPAFAGRHKQWRGEAACVLATGLLSMGIWAAWIAMYVYGNDQAAGGGPSWDDPTLAIALVANAWVFLLLHTIPAVCGFGNTEDEDLPGFREDLYPSRGVGYETILKEQSSQNMFMENKAFSMDEPNSGHKPVSPYSGYNGQLRSSVYQPTELALISKGINTKSEVQSYDIPRATATPPAQNGGSSPSSHT
ncbi:G-protein coupled receptor family C group 5 member C isoform X1 [Alosa sapidissima]|uniref:G-protein coupled receptor family C group 5 member C isoform X1 n=1 Tax=Alosa sapidissima TaxID=34773 RepID=UPI001C085790|nr:G-protein coupled receptor family C group 5 member C isoform X1 [Alosa sapidissima]XP_041937973.1 G-protein coupled receptor family C group 5 member C isoform X1 [Alosa sapidissima]XP_041937974.1 G-protein coupled receptor family C group 5 member C isoform X1 [Alosa sapidissima]XP_041937975.1 G-protein coupled receptor family C group 5 member C isoform X1 [Alosa sapidissima]XP_041937976.1 G-protein coupled receptor family C group 5 member C isoform X1 [Alosa sapidissima]